MSYGESQEVIPQCATPAVSTRWAQWLPCRSFNQRPTLKGPRPHKKQTPTDVRGHPCTHAHTQQVTLTVRVLQAEALMQGTGSGKHPKLPNVASVAYMYKCGQPLLKASNNKGLKPERAWGPLSPWHTQATTARLRPVAHCMCSIT